MFVFILFKRAKVSDEIPEATEDYSKEFSKLSSKTEMDKVSVRVIVLKQCTGTECHFEPLTICMNHEGLVEE